jgi:hypothetical protein
VPDYSVNHFTLGDYNITEGPLLEGGGRISMWRKYQIELDGKVIGTQISRPSIHDCETARVLYRITHPLRHRI